MFGGLAFLNNGNMAVAASGRGGLMVRVPPDDTDGVRTRRQLEGWVGRGTEYARTLRPK